MSETKSSWVTAKPEEIKKQIIELAKQGLTSEKIGLVLRDQHGIPRAKLLGLKIGKILHEANLWRDSENEHMEKKIEILSKHGAQHKHDYKAQRSLVRNMARHKLLKKRG